MQQVFEAICNRMNLLERRGGTKQEHAFVAWQTDKSVGVPQRRPESSAYKTKYFISDFIAEDFIDICEMIDAYAQDHERDVNPLQCNV